MTRHSTITNPPADDNSAKIVSAADLNRMYADIQAKFTAILFALKTRYPNKQDYAVQMDLFDTAFRLCHSPQQQLDLLNSWLKDGAK